jgi:hypothetical protein
MLEGIQHTITRHSFKTCFTLAKIPTSMKKKINFDRNARTHSELGLTIRFYTISNQKFVNDFILLKHENVTARIAF